MSIAQIKRSIKNKAFDPIEVSVREATSNEPWGASSTLMAQIARATHDYDDYPKLLAMVWKRLTDHDHVLHVKKALLLIEYLLRNGSERFVNDAFTRNRDIARLQSYKYYNKNNEDVARDARTKAKRVHYLLMNKDALAAERKQATKLAKVRQTSAGSDGMDFGNSKSGQWGSGGSKSRKDPTQEIKSDWAPIAVPGDDDADSNHSSQHSKKKSKKKSKKQQKQRNDDDPFGNFSDSGADDDDADAEAAAKAQRKAERAARKSQKAADAAAALQSTPQASTTTSSSSSSSSSGGGGGGGVSSATPGSPMDFLTDAAPPQSAGTFTFGDTNDDDPWSFDGMGAAAPTKWEDDFMRGLEKTETEQAFGDSSGGFDGDPFAVEAEAAAPTPAEAQAAAAKTAAAAKDDIWSLASGMANLDNLNESAKPKPVKKTIGGSGMTMAEARAQAPLGKPTSSTAAKGSSQPPLNITRKPKAASNDAFGGLAW